MEGDRDTLALFAKNPFPDQPPRFVRLEWDHYQFTPSNDQSGNWWKRERIDAYLDPMSLDNPGLQKALRQLRDSSR